MIYAIGGLKRQCLIIKDNFPQHKSPAHPERQENEQMQGEDSLAGQKLLTKLKKEESGRSGKDQAPVRASAKLLKCGFQEEMNKTIKISSLL